MFSLLPYLPSFPKACILYGFDCSVSVNLVLSLKNFKKIKKRIQKFKKTNVGIQLSPLRLDLLKKHLAADSIAMRLLYSIITRMWDLVGMKRFEGNSLPTFEGVTEDVFNSIRRRSLVIIFKAQFLEMSRTGSKSGRLTYT